MRKPKKKAVRKKTAQKIEEAKGYLLPKSAPVAGVDLKSANEERDRKRRINVCGILSGGLLEACGTLRRVRYALESALSEETRTFLEQSSERLFQAALNAELEACALRTQEENKKEGMWQVVKPVGTDIALSFAMAK